jgi:hypothetical protein
MSGREPEKESSRIALRSMKGSCLRLREYGIAGKTRADNGSSPVRSSQRFRNAVTTAVHDRMQVILNPDGYDLWLDPGMTNVGAASDLVKPIDARLMRCYPISTRINSVVNDDEECSAPVELAEIQHRLFL